MRFLNSIRLMIENFKYAYRMLLYKCIIIVVAAALCCAFVLPEMAKFWNTEQVQLLSENVKAFFKSFVALDSTGLESAKNALLGENGAVAGLIRMLADKRTELLLTAIGIVIVYLIKRIADTVCHFTTGSLLNDKMSTYADMSFSTSAVSNLGKALVYAFAYVPLIFIYDIAVLFVCWLLLSSTPIWFGGITCVTLMVFCQAMKLTITVYWMPAMTDGANLRQAMKSQGKEARSQGWKVFGIYFASVYFVFIINVIALICTFGSALIITLPASYFFFICEQYVCYYTIKGKKYFISHDRIATSLDKGDVEHFFNYVQKDEVEQLRIEEMAVAIARKEEMETQKSE